VTNTILLLAMSLEGGIDSERQKPMCGEKAVFTSLNVLGVNCELTDVSRRMDNINATGPHSLADLAMLAESYGTYPLVVKLANVDDLRAGAIVHIRSELGHFQTVLGFENSGIVLGDAPMPPIRYEKSYYLTLWSSHALLIFGTATERRNYHWRLMVQKCLLRGLIVWPTLMLGLVCCSWRWRSSFCHPARQAKT
jgi:hypothetical protein